MHLFFNNNKKIGTQKHMDYGILNLILKHEWGKLVKSKYSLWFSFDKRTMVM